MRPVCYQAEPAIPMTKSGRQGLSLTRSRLRRALASSRSVVKSLSYPLTDLCEFDILIRGPGS